MTEQLFKEDMRILIRNYFGNENHECLLVFYLKNGEATACDLSTDKLTINKNSVIIERKDGFNIADMNEIVCLDCRELKE